MSFENEQNDILDLFFDGSPPLSLDYDNFLPFPSKVHTIDMNDFDPVSCDMLDEIFMSPSVLEHEESHSPRNSDSGLSSDGIDDVNINATHDHSYTIPETNPVNHYTTLNDVSSDNNTKSADFSTDFLASFDESIFDTIADDGISFNLDMPATPVQPRTLKLTKVDSLPVTVNDITSTHNPYETMEELLLSDEEKLLLAKEGFILPTHLPLTRDEEQQLKSIRRKIRNKISAKESRKRKMTYMEGLEKRVKCSTLENTQLRTKITALEEQNLSLVEQLKKLQKLVTSKSKKTANTSTCVMVLAFSFMFILIPSYGPLKQMFSPQQTVPYTSTIHPGNSRSLLQDKEPLSIDHDLDPLGVSSWPQPPWSEPQQSANIRFDESHDKEIGKKNFYLEEDMYTIVDTRKTPASVADTIIQSDGRSAKETETRVNVTRYQIEGEREL